MRFRVKCWSVCRRALMPGTLIRGTKDVFNTVVKMWRQEWKVEGFTLKYPTPEHFTRCHWQKAEKVTSVWIIYRAFVAVYFVLSFLYTVIPIGRTILEENRQKYLIYLTHWTYLIEVFQFILALIIVLIKVVQESKNPSTEPMEKLPWYYKMYWVFYTITVPASVLVSVIFWTCVFDPELHPANASNVIEHFFNSFFMIIDFWLVGHPLKFLHFYFPTCYGIIYMIFSIIYQTSGGRGVKGEVGIYQILDWRYPGRSFFTCVFCLLFLMFIHFLFGCCSVCKAVIKKNQNQ